MSLAFDRSRLPPAQDGEAELRRQVDRAIGRALVDRTYAARLLDDPTKMLGRVRDAVEYSTDVGGIGACSLQDLAAQLHALFWPTLPDVLTR